MFHCPNCHPSMLYCHSYSHLWQWHDAADNDILYIPIYIHVYICQIRFLLYEINCLNQATLPTGQIWAEFYSCQEAPRGHGYRQSQVSVAWFAPAPSFHSIKCQASLEFWDDWWETCHYAHCINLPPLLEFFKMSWIPHKSLKPPLILKIMQKLHFTWISAKTCKHSLNFALFGGPHFSWGLNFVIFF